MTTENQKMITHLFGEQIRFTPSAKTTKQYEKVSQMVLKTILDNDPKNCVITQDFTRVVSSESAILMSPATMIVPIIVTTQDEEIFFPIMIRTLKETLKRASSAPGKNLRFRYLVATVQDNIGKYVEKGKQLVVLMYDYTFEAAVINCGWCMVSFPKTRDWSKFCSDKCRQAAHRAKSNG